MAYGEGAYGDGAYGGAEPGTLAGRTVITSSDIVNTIVDVSSGLESGEPTHGAGVLSSWLEWTAPRDGRLTLTVNSLGGSAPQMAIYEGDPSSFAGLTLIAATASGMFSPKTLEATGLVEGETYYIQVGTDSGSGAGDKGVYGCMFDDFSEAKPIDVASGSQTGVHTLSLTTETGENTQPASGLYGTGGTFWLSYTPATSGTLTLTNNSGREIMGGVYTGASLPGTLVQGWRTGDGGTLSQAVTAGTTYLIQFAKYGSAPDGELSLGWSGPAPVVPGGPAAGSLAATLPTPDAVLAGTYVPPTRTGSLTVTLPAPSVAVAGSYVAPEADPSGVLAATIPVPAAALSGSYTAPVAPAAGTLTATLPVPTTALAGLYTPAPGSGFLAATLPSPTVTLTGTYAAPPPPTVGTDTTSDVSLGYGYDGYGTVGDDLSATPIPAGVYLPKIMRVHQSLPAPTLVDGRPT